MLSWDKPNIEFLIIFTGESVDTKQIFDMVCAASILHNSVGLESPAQPSTMDVFRLCDFLRESQNIPVTIAEGEGLIEKYEVNPALKEARRLSFVTFCKMLRHDPLFMIDEEVPCDEKVSVTLSNELEAILDWKRYG